MKGNASKPESKSDSLFGSTNIDFNLLQSVKVAVTSAPTTMEMEHTVCSLIYTDFSSRSVYPIPLRVSQFCFLGDRNFPIANAAEPI